jgi:hypothetical protein
MRSRLGSLLIVFAAACSASSPALHTTGGPFNDNTIMACSLEGSEIIVENGTGRALATTGLHITTGGGPCIDAGKASWSVQVPEAASYRIVWVNNKPPGSRMESDVIPFERLQAQGFRVHLIAEFGPDLSNAHLTEVTDS